MQKITTNLWFDNHAEQAAAFYVSLFKNSKVVSVSHYGEAGPGPSGSVMTVKFQLDGQEYVGLNGGSVFKFTPAISLIVNCENQEEVDCYWEKLSEEGEKGVCGWITDKYGVSWQIVPTILEVLVNDPDTVKAQRVMKAMLQMKKIVIAELEQAYRQKECVKISVDTTVGIPVEKVWEYWTSPEHITKWNFASDDWQTSLAENDLRAGGKLVSRMEVKDGSQGFDFSGTYNEIKLYELISYTMDDGRKVEINFLRDGSRTKIVEIFEAENENAVEMQRQGWQSILDNFKKYAEKTDQ
ncbi:MAG TPA: VOC family protein [Clostridiaceae bacterium]